MSDEPPVKPQQRIKIVHILAVAVLCIFIGSAIGYQLVPKEFGEEYNCMLYTDLTAYARSQNYTFSVYSVIERPGKVSQELELFPEGVVCTNVSGWNMPKEFKMVTVK